VTSLTIATLAMTMQSMIAVPGAVQTELDAICRGWKLAPVLPEIAEEIKTRTPAWPPNLLPGDFNGDGAIDVAVLVECKATVQLVAFLSRESGFSSEILEKPEPLDPRQFLHLIRKEYGNDAIGVEYEAIGGHAWVYRDRKWTSVTR
jgi:hypothetical protein